MPQSPSLSATARRSLSVVSVVSLAILASGLYFAPERAWSNLLAAALFLLTIGLGGTLFLALALITGAGWHVAFRRVPEAMAMIVPLTGGALLVVLALGAQYYAWQPHGDVGTFWFKQFWLTPTFWFARSAAYVIIWSVLGALLVYRSRKQDTAPVNVQQHTGNVRLAALFLVVYAITFSLASVDWLMALDPMWYSTIWGIYNFAGMMVAALAVIVILCIVLSAPGRPLHGVFTTEHLHDLGKLLLSFSCFWMYIWFSQYMLIWYANIPEETSHFVTRTTGPWGPVVVASLVLNWLAPFFILLPRPSKRSRSVMLRVAVVILVGRGVDVWLMIFPSTLGDTPAFGIWELAAIACVVTAAPLLLARAFASAPPVPVHDPFLPESLHYHA